MNPFSVALVVAQMTLIVSLASPLSGLQPTSLPDVFGLLLLSGGIALALIAFVAMRQTRFSVLPEPRAGGKLVQLGLYRYVRHPMYAAVMLSGLGACIAQADLYHWLLLGVLGVVLAVKIRHEETLLLAAYPAYADYRRRVKAIVPGLW